MFLTSSEHDEWIAPARVREDGARRWRRRAARWSCGSPTSASTASPTWPWRVCGHCWTRRPATLSRPSAGSTIGSCGRTAGASCSPPTVDCSRAWSLAAVLTPLIALAALAAIVALAPTKIAIGVGIAAVVGIVRRGAASARAGANGREVDAAEEPELHAIVERLCVVADLPKPAIVVEAERAAQQLGRQPRARPCAAARHARAARPAGAGELEAVVAHELAHVAHRDATVMTVVGGPGAVLLGGGSRTVRSGGFWLLMLGGAIAIAIGWLTSVGTRMLSRYREFGADAGRRGADRQPGRARVRAAEGRRRRRRDARQGPARRRGARPFHLLPVARGAATTGCCPRCRRATRRCGRGSPGWSAWRPGCSARAGREPTDDGRGERRRKLSIRPIDNLPARADTVVCRRPRSPSPRRPRPSAAGSTPISRASSGSWATARGRGAGLVVLPGVRDRRLSARARAARERAATCRRRWTPRVRRSRG